MVCCGCVLKLAMRLIVHHRKRLDYIMALTLAEKGMERVDRNRRLRFPRKIGKGNPSDYTQPCDTGIDVCEWSFLKDECSRTEEPCTCPDPLPNSHYVSDDCAPDASCFAQGNVVACRAVDCTGTCEYDCDEDYEWNAETEECELIAVEKKVLGDGLVFAEW